MASSRNKEKERRAKRRSGIWSAIVLILSSVIPNYIRTSALVLVAAVVFSIALGIYSLSLTEWMQNASHPEKITRWIMGILALVFIGAAICYLNWPSPVVAVSPEDFPLARLVNSPDKRLHGKVSFSIYNRSDDPYYQIWVRLHVNSQIVRANNLYIDFPTLETKVRLGDNPRIVQFSAFCLRGSGTNFNQDFSCCIRSLSPRESFEIKLTNGSIPDTDKELGTITGAITNIDTQPPEELEGRNGAGSSCVVHGNLNFDQAIYYCPAMSNPRPPFAPDMACTPDSKPDM
jgi:hypothetical protein